MISMRLSRSFGLVFFLILGFIPQALLAAVIHGRIVGVSDGDTVKVLDSAQQLHTVRLMGIDAPEKAQPFGQRSKQSLSELVYQQHVRVEWSKEDKYGRVVGKIRLQDGLDVCLEQIKRGMAWHYKQYTKEQPVEDQVTYAKFETEAKDRKVGLWSDDAPTPPWLWRKQSVRK